MVDFCFPRETMDRLNEEAASIVVLDHHKTTREAMTDFQCRCGKVHFDMHKSGARLAWEYFHPNTDVPEIILRVEDRDLWRWDMDGSADFLAALDTRGFEFATWQQVMTFSPSEQAHFVAEGRAMNEKFRALCRNVEAEAVEFEIAGVKGLAANASRDFSSDVGNRLAVRSGTFGAVWYVGKGGQIRFSLRSNAPFEVHRIAQQYGGGGHPNASGFLLPISRISEVMQRCVEATS